MLTLAELTSRHAQDGKIEWIGVRPARNQEMVLLERAEILEKGLVGDRTVRANRRSVTLIQWEHLAVIASLVSADQILPSQLRRNIVVRGINLLALKTAQFKIGDAVLEGTGICAPCSKMETTLGHGGYNALRGHGGITAQVLHPGLIKLGDPISPYLGNLDQSVAN